MKALRLHRLPALAWPLPALLAWAACWATQAALVAAGGAVPVAFAVACGLGALLALRGSTPWRRVFVGAGFPLSFVASGAAAAWPAWTWLLPLSALAVLYPARAWRDAPLFPTPAGALESMGRLVRLAPGARVLDAGCGLGAGLAELRRRYPQAALDGIEWSWPIATAARWRCADADVRRGDLWAADWSPYALVYLFQRPESMPRAAEKARRQLAPGAWLASLEFPARDFIAEHVVDAGGGRSLWLYRAPLRPAGDGAIDAVVAADAAPRAAAHAASARTRSGDA